MRGPIDSFLPGELWIERGDIKDFKALERFHYRRARPATWAGIWVVRYRERRPAGPPRPVGVAVLSYACLNSAARDAVLGIGGMSAREKAALVNRDVRTISRVIVHPQFRGVGLASRLVRCLCEECPTRFVEAYAAMGRVHPLFEKGGMTRVGVDLGKAVYYWLEKSEVGIEKSEKEVAV